tara:strand:+ start:101 stop:280 length:180 start_codon:yes stop_codon:yes gene_type:complete
MRPKVITLCDATWKLAKEKENFSEWVRAQLLATDEDKIEKDRVAFLYWKKNGVWPEWYE